MKPVLFNIGPLPISAFGLFLLLAFWLGISMARRRSGAVGIDSNTMLDVALYMIIAGIVGGRIGYVLVNLPAFITQVSTDPLAPVSTTGRLGWANSASVCRHIPQGGVGGDVPLAMATTSILRAPAAAAAATATRSAQRVSP